jgi:predicted AlkP superfamily phosphohydrolase/phosphomutase
MGAKDPKLDIKPTKAIIKDFTCHSTPLQISIEIDSNSIQEPKTLDGFIIDKDGDGYNNLIVETSSGKQLAISMDDEWSDWISLSINTEYGILPCLFKLKIHELSPDGKNLRLRHSALYNAKGWITPESIGEDFIRNVMNYELTFEEKKVEYMITGRVSMFLKNSKREADTLAHAINYVNKKVGWDMCFFHVHHLDSINHKYLGLVYEDSPVYSEAKYEKTWEKIQASYVIVDDMVGNLMENSVDENTIVCFITDHGAIPTWKVANIPRALVRSGLLSYKWLHNDNKYIIDWDKTKAFPYMEPPYIWVNLKGRDPQGIVRESEYDSVRDEIIESLYQMRDPETGDRIVKLAIKREEAEFLGQNGKRIGDVIFFLNAPYELFDGVVEQLNPANPLPNILVQPDAYDAIVCFGAHAYYLPTERVGEYSISVPLIMSGPGIRKGVELKRPVNLIDFAPTISHLLGIPRPKDAVGRVLYEVME